MIVKHGGTLGDLPRILVTRVDQPKKKLKKNNRWQGKKIIEEDNDYECEIVRESYERPEQQDEVELEGRRCWKGRSKGEDCEQEDKSKEKEVEMV